MRLALAIIAKDEQEKLNRIIDKYRDYFDEIAIAIDDQAVFNYFNVADDKVKVYKYEWRDDFAHKRNWLAGKIKSEYYLRLDTDDEIDHPELIKEAFKTYVENGFTLVHFMYYYAFDESGNCIAKHWRETIIKNDGNLFWNKPIHENINPKYLRKVRAGKESKIGLVHRATEEELKVSRERNLNALLKEYEATKDKPDARTVGYIARMYYGLKQYIKAIPFFENFLTHSGWDDDKYFAWVQLCECYQSIYEQHHEGKWLEGALNCCVEAFLLNPHYPDVYFHFLGVFFDKGEYDKAIEIGEMGFTKKTPDTMLVLDPSAYTWRPLATLAACYMQKGRFKDALKLLKKAVQIVPKEESVQKLLKFLTEVYVDNAAAEDYLKLMNYTKHDLRLFRSLVKSIPRKIRNDERLLTLKNSIEPGCMWGEKTITFFCGGAWEDWVDSSVVGGIGGSEEATIYLSREFTKLGYLVTVYNQCGELAGEYKGVEYKPYYEFNPKDQFNILISWRQNVNAKAKKKFIWMHDIPPPDMFLPEDQDTYDKVLVLSEFHKSFLKNVPEDKIYVTRNGLNMSDYEGIEEQRSPHRMIYASSYDRGLEKFLEIVWKKVIAKFPDAELHIYYGWNTYDEMVKVGRRSAEWKQHMVNLMNQKGVYEHGRIGHKKLIREYFKSGIWVYPTTFEEISCIGAMRAQVCGAVPVVNNYAALKETVQFGEKIEGDVKKEEIFHKYENKLVELLKDPAWQDKIRKEMVLGAKEMFSWEKVAQKWQKDLF